MSDFKVSVDRMAFKNFIEAIRTVGDEVGFEFTKKRVKVLCIDPSHVAMLEAEMPVTQVTGLSRGKIMVNLSLNQLLTFVKTAGSDQVSFSFDGEKKMVTLKAEGSRKKIILTTLSKEATTTVEMPKLDPPVKLKLKNAVEFKDSIKTTTKLGVSVQVRMSLNADPLNPEKKVLSLESEGDSSTFTDAIEVEIVDGDEEVSSMFPMDYMNSIAGAIVPGMDVEFQMGADYPIIIQMQHGDTKYKFLMAPRIEN